MRPASTYPLPEERQYTRARRPPSPYREMQEALRQLRPQQSLLMPRHLTARSCYNYAWFIGQALGRRFAVRRWAPGRYRIWRVD